MKYLMNDKGIITNIRVVILGVAMFFFSIAIVNGDKDPRLTAKTSWKVLETLESVVFITGSAMNSNESSNQ